MFVCIQYDENSRQKRDKEKKNECIRAFRFAVFFFPFFLSFFLSSFPLILIYRPNELREHFTRPPLHVHIII